MKDVLAVGSLVVSLLSYVPYVKEMLAGKVKPERIAWLLWAILGCVYFFSTVFAEGARLYALGELIAPAIIFILALKYGVGGTNRFDMVCLVIAAVALSLLLFSHDVLISLLIAIFVDTIGFGLTLKKLKDNPNSESTAFWVLVAVSAVLALLSLNEYTLVAVLFPGYFLVIASIILATIKAQAK